MTNHVLTEFGPRISALQADLHTERVTARREWRFWVSVAVLEGAAIFALLIEHWKMHG